MFVRRFIALSRQEGFEYSLIEAFDQDWKYRSEGTVGANWGLWTADRQPKFPLSGPVEEDPGWRVEAAISVALGLVLLATTLRLHRRSRGKLGLAAAPSGRACDGTRLGAGVGMGRHCAKRL